MLNDWERPSPDNAQRLISTALDAAYLSYALKSTHIASWLLLGSLVIRVVGVGEP
jgi:hypothetical protein